MSLSLKKIKSAVENYYDLWAKQKELQNRLINLSGRDPEQEMAILMRLESIEKQIEFIDKVIFDDDESILSLRDQAIVMQRMEGHSIKEIAEFFLLTQTQIRNILYKAYQKMADKFSDMSTA